VHEYRYSIEKRLKAKIKRMHKKNRFLGLDHHDEIYRKKY
jgi:hypothetical protein